MKGFKIELTSIWKQSIVIGYLEISISGSRSKKTITITRFHIYKLYRKFGYTERTLKGWVKRIFDLYNDTKQIFIKQYEDDKDFTAAILNSGFKLCKFLPGIF